MTGIGVDLCSIERFIRLKEDTHFLQRIFTPSEIEYCQKKKKSEECFAVRFAAKEAFMKALGTGYAKGVSFKEIEIVKDENGQPSIKLNGLTNEIYIKSGASKVMLSLSHERQMAIAMVFIE